MKRVLSLFLSCIFVLGVCFSTPIVASATETNTNEFTTVSGVFQYVEGSNECSVKEWRGSGGDLTLTDVQYNETTYTITGILSGAFSGCTDLETLTIKSNIETIEAGAFVGCTALTAFIESTESENAEFEVVDGVLFNEDKTTLIAYPAGKIDEEGNKVTEYTIPATVTEIATGAFADCSNLKIIYNGHNIEWENIFAGELAETVTVDIETEGCEGEEIKYAAAGDKITISCSGCSKKFGTITLEAPEKPESAESLIYDGTAKEATVKVEGITGLEEIPEVSYGVDEKSNPVSPINAGSYTATFTVSENVKVTKEFTIEPKVIDVNLGFGGEQPDSLVYNGNEHILVVDFGEEILYVDDDYTIEYVNNKNAGEIIATVRLTEGGNYAFLDGETLTYSKTINSGINIEKVTPEVTIVKAENLVFTNEEQPLLTTANTTFGTLKFSLEDTEDETKWSTAIPTTSAAGTHTVYYKVVGDSNVEDLETQSVTVTISAHNHLWSYEADDVTDTITATCSGAGYCGVENKKTTITLKLLENPDWVYNNETKKFAYVEGSIDGVTLPGIVYSGDCINAGDYTASITLGEATVSAPFTIKKATPTFTAPTANELTYSSNPQSLVTAGFATNGTMQYSLDGNSWSDDIPTGINAGTYKVYYKVVGNENYFDVDERSVDVTIAPKTIEAMLTPDNGVYNGSAHVPTVEFNGLCGNETLVKGTDYTVNYVDNTNVGTATVTVTLQNTEKAKNYTFADNAKATTLNYRITEGVASIETAPTGITGLVYTGSAQELVTAGSAIGGTMQYRLSENESWSPAIPTAINAETYTVYYKVVGDENHSDSEVASVDVTIAKATPTADNFIFTSPANLIYNGEPKEANIDCGADIGVLTIKYYSGETLLESAPVEVGTYTVKIDVAASDNYNASTEITSDDWKFTIIACKHEWVNGLCTTCNTECEHKFDLPEITKNPTCNAPGELTWACTICDHSEVTTVNPDGDGKTHDWSGDYVVTKAATCVSEGIETKTCKNGCGQTQTREIAVDTEAHVMGEWVTTEQTCVADGKKVRSCTLGCGATETEVIKADNESHKLPDEWTVTKEANCVEDGEKIKACLNEGCTYVAKESIPADGKSHNLGEWEVTIPAKCTVKGEVTQYCQNGDCTHKVTASLKPDGKTHSFAEDFTIIEATCITAGSKFKACENEGCKEVAEKTEIAINPDAHKNVETINVKQPTCEEKGYTGDEHCNDCKKTFEPGIEVDALGHTESDWIVDKEATFTEDGARHTACTVCNKELKKEVIAKRVLETPVVKIENAGSGIKVSWSQDEDATGYTVYRSEYNPSTKKWSKWKNRGTAAATKKNWTDKTVKEGVTYRFTVRSVNGDIKSAYKATSGILYVVAPKVTISISSTGLLAKWNKINNATSYIVYRAELGTDGNWGKWVQLGTTKAEKNTWSDDKVKSGVTYKYTVRAVVGKVKSGYTGSSAIIYLEQPLLKIANAENGITGKWEQVAGATGYTIYRSEYNSSTKKWTKWLNLGTTKATAKSFTDKTAKSGYQYKYTIRAVNGKLKSTYQDSNKLVCLAQPTLKISNVANGIQGKWTKVDGATGYIIYRSELKDGKWTKWVSLGTAKSTAKSFTDKTVKSGVQYKYTIRAKNGSSKSSYIDSNTSVFLSVPTVKIANAATGVKVTWGKIEGAKNYLVYRSEYNLSTKKWSKWKTLETVDTTSFVDETAVSNVKYKYTVRALNGEFRSYYTASVELLYLKAPTVTAEKEDEAIKVSWTKVDGAKSYIIYRSELSKDGKWSKWIKLGTAGEKYTSCKDKTVKEDVTYKYTVRAVNGKLMGYYVASEQILNGVVTESTPENPKTDIVA